MPATESIEVRRGNENEAPSPRIAIESDFDETNGIKDVW